MNWLVLYTKPHFEIKVAQILNSLGITAYCPTLKLIKQYSDRKKKVKTPLLRSYVFVQIDEKERNRVFSVPGVVRYLFWLGKPAQVLDQEIEIMKNNLDGLYDDVSIEKLSVGENYNIPWGPFKGHTGKVVSLNCNKIKLELPTLGVVVLLKAA